MMSNANNYPDVVALQSVRLNSLMEAANLAMSDPSHNMTADKLPAGELRPEESSAERTKANVWGSVPRRRLRVILQQLLAIQQLQIDCEDVSATRVVGEVREGVGRDRGVLGRLCGVWREPGDSMAGGEYGDKPVQGCSDNHSFEWGRQ